MADEIEHLRSANPVSRSDVAVAVDLDARLVVRSLRDADNRRQQRPQPLERPSRTMARASYVVAAAAAAAALAAAAGFAGIADPAEHVASQKTSSTAERSGLTLPSESAAGDPDAPDHGVGAPLYTSSDTTIAASPPSIAVDAPPAGDAPLASDAPAGAEPDRSDQSFDPHRDLLALHYDTEPDDGLAAVATREITDRLGLQPHVVGGTTGRALGQPDGFVSVMDAAWDDRWWNAAAEWESAVDAAVDAWLSNLDDGGRVWVAEAGAGGFTAAVIREIATQRPEIDTTAAIRVVQHSGWSERITEPADLALVRSATVYVLIDDGNERNETANFHQSSAAFVDAALTSRSGDRWAAGLTRLGSGDSVDFSDAVEVLHILGIGTDTIADVDDFAAVFLD